MRKLFCKVILLFGRELFLSRSFAVLGLEWYTHSCTWHFKWGFTVQRQKVSQGGKTVDIPGLGAEINHRQVITSLLLIFMWAFPFCKLSVLASEHPESDRGAPRDPGSLQPLECEQREHSVILGSDLSSKLLSPMQSPVPAPTNEGVCISQLH